MTKQTQVSIVLATYNERENIEEMIKQIFHYLGSSTEIIVVDDNSPDKTWQAVERLNYPSLRLIRRTNERGLASAFDRGIREAKGEVIGWMDSDLTMPPSLLPAMLSKLSEYDIVIGSRYADGGKDARSFFRVFFSRCINGLAQIVLDSGIKDFDSGFVLVKRKVAQEVPIIARGYGEYFIEFLYAAKKKNFTMFEFPYVFRERSCGTSKSFPNLVHFFKTGFEYIGRIFAARFRN